MLSENIFRRVQTAYDLERMKRSRIIYVGTGGSRSFAEDMARCGVAEHILIDPDTVQEPNIATQQAYLEDVGSAKVDCIADRIIQINPDAQVVVYQQALDEIDDLAFSGLVNLPSLHGGDTWHKPIHSVPYKTLLCGFTDNFYAQARINRLALQFGIPSLCAQLYQFGQAAEITFTYPGVTAACQRCMLSPRYKAYLEQGYQNTVTSHGTPIFATQRLNALTGMIAMSLLHHGTDHPVWGEMLSRIGNRTLVQIRMHPDTQLSVFNRVFAGADTERVFFDEAVWLPQEPDPNCPECKGTGDLRTAKRSFVDTRVMPGRQADLDKLPSARYEHL